jgi:hypothetical protein
MLACIGRLDDGSGESAELFLLPVDVAGLEAVELPAAEFVLFLELFIVLLTVANWPPSPEPAEVLELLVAAPVSPATIPKYASFRTRFSSKGQALPVPGNVLGTQEY